MGTAIYTVGDSTYASAASSPAGDETGGHVASSVFNTGLVGTALMNSPGNKVQYLDHLTDANPLEVIVNFKPISGTLGDTLEAGKSYPLTMDFVTYGQSNDGVEQSDRHMNGIWRFESKENAVNSGVMTVSYTHLTLPTIYSV